MDGNYECVYTKHLTQKRKTWHDGTVKVVGSKATLYNESKTRLDETFLKKDDTM